MAEKNKIDIWGMLNKKYPPSEYALMAEVSDSSGFSRSRSADYIAVNLWPSRGHAVNGIELKSFRSDWLSELKKPEKAENIFQYCDYFWLLTTDDTIAKMEEIPDTWGWMCVKGSTIRVMKQAPKLTPREIGKGFMCAMLKRAADKRNFVHVDSIADKIEAASDVKYSHELIMAQKRAGDYDKLIVQVIEFERHSGIDIRNNRWRGEDYLKGIGQTISVIQNGGAEAQAEKLKDLLDTAKKVVSSISKNIELLTPKIENKNEDHQTN